MKNVMRLVILVICLGSNVAPSFAGNCDYSWQTASNGSSCGGRAADQRPGGKFQ